MKRILAIIITLAILTTFISCGNNSDTDATTCTTEAATTAATTVTTATVATTTATTTADTTTATTTVATTTEITTTAITVAVTTTEATTTLATTTTAATTTAATTARPGHTYIVTVNTKIIHNLDLDCVEAPAIPGGKNWSYSTNTMEELIAYGYTPCDRCFN